MSRLKCRGDKLLEHNSQLPKVKEAMGMKQEQHEDLEEYDVIIKVAKVLGGTTKWLDSDLVNYKMDVVEYVLHDAVNTGWVLYDLDELRQHSELSFVHSVNMAVFVTLLGIWLGYGEEDLRNLAQIGLLHDIGKLFVPLNILHKPGRLSRAEFEVMKKHVYDGYLLLTYNDYINQEVKLGILQHHERLDGSGYPFNLKDNEIHEFSKIAAVADMYTAMIEDRTYRPKMTPLAALEVIEMAKGTKLDARVCEALRKIVMSTGKNYQTN
ncbi:MAG: hypothetical protein H6Q67_759 [Firmicutes bacterium]|nr:hypothetical protein [Bacillota bacterium]